MTEHERLQPRSFRKTSLMEVRQNPADCGPSHGLGSGGADSLAEDDDAAHSGTPATLD